MTSMLLFAVALPAHATPTIEQLEEACEADPKRCAEAGARYLGGGDAARDIPTAVARFRVSCEARDPRGCMMMGESARDGVAGTVRPGEVVQWMDLACTEGVPRACRELGKMMVDGQATLGIAAQPEAAIALFERGCRLRDGYSCGSFGYELRNGASPRPDMAVAVFDRGCTYDNAYSCGHMGEMLAEGLGVPTDIPTAIRAYTRGCELGDAGDCGDAGFWLATGPRPGGAASGTGPQPRTSI